jgi:hypothetical protein
MGVQDMRYHRENWNISNESFLVGCGSIGGNISPGIVFSSSSSP